MNILVTGGAGYIGSHTVRLLHETGHQVIVYDNLIKGHRQAVTAGIFVQGDLFNGELLTETLRRYHIDAVVHFAAYSIVGESMRNPELYYTNNVQGTLNLLHCMRDSSIDKLVFSSTAAVYGEPDIVPIDESVSKQPTNVYGRTKWLIENAIADYAAYGLRSVSLRYFNACGAHPAGDIGEDHAPETHLIPLVLQTCLGKRECIQIFGTDYPTKDGTCVRDYIHVCDLADAHGLAVEALADGCASAAYNLGNGSGFTVKEIVEAAERITGITIGKEYAPRRSGDPAILIASSEKIKKELGWQPVYQDIHEIIESAWRWHKNHPTGYADK